MVVGKGRSKEIATRASRLYYYLGAAEIRLGLIAYDFARDGYIMLEVRRNLEYRDWPFRQFAFYGRTDPGLEMSGISVGAQHGERYSAMGEKQFISVNAGKVALEARAAGELLRHGH